MKFSKFTITICQTQLKSFAIEFSIARDPKIESPHCDNGKTVKPTETNERHIQEIDLHGPCRGNNCLSQAKDDGRKEQQSKYSINNPCELIKNTESSGGVEDLFDEDHIIRLSISPSQGDDPGFKSRPEHIECKVLQ